MKLIVSGDRDWTDVECVERALAWAEMQYPSVERRELLHGDCRGLDTIAADCARKRGWNVTGYPAEWGKHGKSAGPVRNRRMLAATTADVPVLVFHDHPEKSKGTLDMVKISLMKSHKVHWWRSALQRPVEIADVAQFK